MAEFILYDLTGVSWIAANVLSFVAFFSIHAFPAPATCMCAFFAIAFDPQCLSIPPLLHRHVFVLIRLCIEVAIIYSRRGCDFTPRRTLAFYSRFSMDVRMAVVSPSGRSDDALWVCLRPRWRQRVHRTFAHASRRARRHPCALRIGRICDWVLGNVFLTPAASERSGRICDRGAPNWFSDPSAIRAKQPHL